ncbi:aminotransferase [Stappia sp. F7233]|uniref:Aminotransferase n=1 Tax=Stappia albiluteola TaxID=2758565 RepID=A0A839AF64_9HYPH|nr:aminotransferase [Stappia albiluteola]MBA5778261.1 aminotransferase [Stappia albiluteola]
MAALNALLLDTATPPIPEAQAWLRAYDGAFGQPINLSQAVPGDPPPAAFLERLAEAGGSAEAARYGDILGDPALREAHAAESSTLYGAVISASDVAITAGCNQAFFVAVMAIARAGDAILLPAPWYFNHKMTLDMLGIEARPLPLKAEDGFLPDWRAAEALIDRRVKAVVIVSPNNPTGAVTPPEELASFFRLCRQRGIRLILDETYRDFLGETGGRPHDLFAMDEWRDTLVSLYSFSKAHAIPGHRIGAITAAPEFLAEVGKVLDCVQISAPRTAQLALPWAIAELRPWREAMRQRIGARIEAFRAALQPHAEWRIDQIGAYFAYLRHPFDGVPAVEVAERLARERGVLTLPGSYFGPGQESHLRVAFANVGEEIIAGLGPRFAGLAG